MRGLGVDVPDSEASDFLLDEREKEARARRIGVREPSGGGESELPLPADVSGKAMPPSAGGVVVPGIAFEEGVMGTGRRRRLLYQ